MLENDASPAAVGKRLRVLRSLAGLSRISLADAAGVSKTSISYWEHGQGSVIKPRSAEKILEAVEEKGIKCTETWLMTGNGPPPTAILEHAKQLSPKESNVDINELSFVQEITTFLSACRNPEKAVILKVENDSMLPFFEKGDVLGGLLLPPNKVNTTKEKICIVKINGKLDVRRVKKGTSPEKFTVSYLSYDEHCSSPFEINDVTLEFLAPVIRVWR